jgi:hypothetical protein
MFRYVVVAHSSDMKNPALQKMQLFRGEARWWKPLTISPQLPVAKIVVEGRTPHRNSRIWPSLASSFPAGASLLTPLLGHFSDDTLGFTQPDWIRRRPEIKDALEWMYLGMRSNWSVMAYMHQFSASSSMSNIGPSSGWRMPNMRPSRARTAGR